MKKFIIGKVLFYIGITITFLITCFLIYGLLDIFVITPPKTNEDGVNTHGLTMAIYLIIFVIIIGGIGYFISVIINIISTIILTINLKKGTGNKPYFILSIAATILPILLWFTFLLITINQ